MGFKYFLSESTKVLSLQFRMILAKKMEKREVDDKTPTLPLPPQCVNEALCMLPHFQSVFVFLLLNFNQTVTFLFFESMVSFYF